MHTMPMMPQIDLLAGSGTAMGAPQGAQMPGQFGQVMAGLANTNGIPAQAGLPGDLTPETLAAWKQAMQAGVVPELAQLPAEVQTALSEGLLPDSWSMEMDQLVDQLPDDPAQLAQVLKEMAPELRAKLMAASENTEVATPDGLEQQAVDPPLIQGMENPMAAMAAPSVEVAKQAVQTQVPVIGQQQAQLQGQDVRLNAEAKPMVVQPQVAQAQVEDVVPSHLKQEMDPRFAELLQPKGEEATLSLRQQMAPGLREGMAQPNAEGTMAKGMFSEVAPEAKPEAILNAVKNLAGKQPAGPELNPNLSQGQTTPFVGPNVLHAESVQAPVTAQPVVQMPSGQQVAESVILDQVVTHLSGSQDGESGKMVLRLRPAELGEVKLDLIMDADRLKVQLHAQTQQVQEVIERHLPKLRDALEQQGMKVDDLQVNVGTEDEASESWFARQDQQQQQNLRSHNAYPENDAWALEGADEGLASQPLMMNAGGISLRV